MRSEKILRLCGAILTALIVCGGGLAVTFYGIMQARHARVDSEVGVTVYGMEMIFTLAATIVGTALASGLWGWGILSARRTGSVSRRELIAHGLFFYPTAILSVLILGLLWYRVASMPG